MNADKSRLEGFTSYSSVQNGQIFQGAKVAVSSAETWEQNAPQNLGQRKSSFFLLTQPY